MKKIIKVLFLKCSWMVLLTSALHATCSVITSSGEQATGMKDSINSLLSLGTHCPKNVFELRQRIKENNLTIKTTMVANRGYHNPALGSFSFFEMVTGQLNLSLIQPGDFFLGHFTTVDDNDELSADQGLTDEPRLMIEAFAWDSNKNLFNFYELVGDGDNNQWFYRGDSADIYADNALLHRQPEPSHPQFGNRLRCSGCHGSGGPIMKEIDSPHNDWWTPNRKLGFGGRAFSPTILEFMDNLVSPDELADSVILGLKKLEKTKVEQSLQERLRPLFCPVEVNLRSDKNPNEERSPVIRIPVEFFINKKLVGNQIDSVLIAREAYEKALKLSESHFPETTLQDSDHAWLTPVKASSDQLAIDHLVKVRLIDEKFVYDVLNIDMTNPVFSQARCELLKYVPNTWTNNWNDKFIEALKLSKNKNALELAEQRTNPAHDSNYYQQKASGILKHCIQQLKDEEKVKNLFFLLLQRREEIRVSELSKNRQGQILEPGFRVIFPETIINSMPGKLTLTETCDVIVN